MEIRDTRNGEWYWVYSALLADPHLFPNDKLVYSAISTFGGHQVIHPTIVQIAIRCGVSERGVQVSLNKLEEVGYIEMEKSTGRGNANVYYLLKKPKGCNHCTFSKGRNEQQERVQPSAVKGATTAPHIDIYKDKKDTESEIRVVSEKEEARKKESSADKQYEELCVWSESRRGFKFVARKSQYTALKRCRENDISITRLKNRWIELEGQPWREGFDWWDVFKSFNKKA